VPASTSSAGRGLGEWFGAPIRREFYGNALLVDGRQGGFEQPDHPGRLNLTDLYAYRVGLDGFHGVAVSGQPQSGPWLPDFTEAGAVETGEVEMGCSPWRSRPEAAPSSVA
jgi:hypothetical protein